MTKHVPFLVELGVQTQEEYDAQERLNIELEREYQRLVDKASKNKGSMPHEDRVIINRFGFLEWEVARLNRCLEVAVSR